MFDLTSGVLAPTPSALEDRSAWWIAQFMQAAGRPLTVPRAERKGLLHLVLAYYRQHVHDAHDLRTLPVIEEIFS